MNRLERKYFLAKLVETAEADAPNDPQSHLCTPHLQKIKCAGTMLI
jgi:hypothetical protein